MKKIILILILSLAALSGEAQVEDFDSISYAIGDSYTRVYLSLNWEWNDTSAVDFLKAIDDHIHYLNYLQDSINSPSFSVGFMQGVFFLDSYEHIKEKDGILLECIIDGMSKVANNDLILPQDTIAIQEYMLSLPDDMNPSELPQEERCKFFSYYGTMKGLQPGLQDYIYEITGKSKDEIPANQKAYATGFLLMLIRMEAQENISSSYELGKIMITDVIFELIRYNSISSKFNLESFKLGCRAAMGLAERKLSISQCDEIATLSRGEDDADDVDDEPKVVTEVLDLNDDERLSLDCNKKLPKDCEVRVYSALSHEELATYINNNRELSKLYSSTGYFSASDTTKMNRLFKKIKLPKNVKTMWLKPWDSKDSFEPLCYYNTPLIKTNGVIESVEIDKNSAGLFSIILKLNDEKQWEQVTEQNIGKRLAFEINGHVLYAPTVHQTITGGRTAVHLTKELLKSIFPLLQVQEIKQSNVPYEIYTKDKTQIADCIMKNVEYYRQNHQDEDSYYWDHANFFEPYSHFYNKKTDEYVIAPIPASQYLIVKVDTIVYNSDGLKCFIFCGFETKTIKSDFLISREPERNFDAKAFVGVRNNITDSITIYPFVKYDIWGYSNYKEAVSDLEYLYFNKLKGETLSASHYVHNSFEQNVGDNDFFEHSVIFQPFDDSTYNYQYCYKELMKYPFSK